MLKCPLMDSNKSRGIFCGGMVMVKAASLAMDCVDYADRVGDHVFCLLVQPFRFMAGGLEAGFRYRLGLKQAVWGGGGCWFGGLGRGDGIRDAITQESEDVTSDWRQVGVEGGRAIGC
jgi:hypothetical protein